jgi:hypothetical protein
MHRSWRRTQRGLSKKHICNSPSIRCNNRSTKHYDKHSKREGKVMRVYLSCLTARRHGRSLAKYQQLVVSSSKGVGARVRNATPACTRRRRPRARQHGGERCEPVQRRSVCRRVTGSIRTCSGGQHTRQTDTRRRRHRGGQCSPGRSARRASKGGRIHHLKLKIEIKWWVLRATAGPGTLTTLQVACGVDALPGTCAPSEHTAGRPAMPHFCTRAAADPALLGGGGLARGARVGSHAVAVADDVGRGTTTHGWVIRGIWRVTGRASEPAGITVDARRNAISWVVAVRRRIVNDLN